MMTREQHCIFTQRPFYRDQRQLFSVPKLVDSLTSLIRHGMPQHNILVARSPKRVLAMKAFYVAVQISKSAVWVLPKIRPYFLLHSVCNQTLVPYSGIQCRTISASQPACQGAFV